MVSAADGTVGKALEVLDLVAAQRRPVRFGELQKLSPHPKATLHRLAQTLVNQGMLTQDPETGAYTLGVRLVRLAHAAWRQSSLAPIARPHLDALANEAGETVHLAQLDHGQVLYLDKRNAADPVEMFSDAGKVGPAYCTGVGKAMLAFLCDADQRRLIPQQSFHRFTEHTLASEQALRSELQAIQRRGFAYDREEHELGIICVAAPILTPEGRVLGALSVTGSKSRTDMARLEGWVPRLKRAAEEIAGDAAAWAFPGAMTAPAQQ